DIIGSVYEFGGAKDTDFPLFTEETTFTDDTVLTIAVADRLLSEGSYVDKLHEYANAYPDRGYGGGFLRWVLVGSREPYNSWGNGSAMRVSPVGFAFNDTDSVLAEAKRSAEVTHNHPEGIKGAQAAALSIFMARTGGSKEQIRDAVESRFGYDLHRSVEEIRPHYEFNESCQGTVPEAIIAFMDSHDYESAIRLAISLGGDADTLACITGGIADAFYGGVPADIAEPALAELDAPLRKIVERFCVRFGVRGC
ncbi:MAG: ADP-ribosylglycohydrolase family protein, partial [bacterium]